MEDNFSIDEILSAVNDLQNISKEKNKKNLKESSEKFDNSNIPVNTLRLIEEAEKSKN
tara:strand:- start:69 stop:242 length:174 start_codon:yes stop_codon:yes gene_type:complete